MAQITEFNPDQHDKFQEMEPLPAGWAVMKIVASEVRPTKADPQQAYLWLEYEVDERYHPHWKGRKAWDRLNLYNKDPQAVRIANSMLKSITLAVGHVGKVSNTEVLHGKPMAVKLKFIAAGNGFNAKNEIGDVDVLGARFPGPATVIAPPSNVPTGANTGASVVGPPAHVPAAAANTAPSAPPWGGAPGQTPPATK